MPTEIINNKNFYTADVVIPVYNDQNFILQAIKSVEQQTIAPKKIIVVNDGSTDNTEKIILNYKKRSKAPITYIKKENDGLSSARNAGIKISTSDFIAFLDSDDVWRKEKLAEQLNIFKKSKYANLGVVYCQYMLIDENNNEIKNNNILRAIDKTIRGNVFEKILEINKIASSASGVLIKKEYLDKSGYFDESLKASEDHDMWLRLAECCEFDYTEKILVKIRKHEKNMQKNSYHIFFNKLIFYDKWIKILNNKNIPIPDFWKKNITGKALRRLPKIDFIKLIKKNLSKESRAKLFLLESFELYALLFLINKLLSFPKKILKL